MAVRKEDRVNREKAYYVVDCRVGLEAKWDRGWFQFHSGPNLRYAQKMKATALRAYAHWPRLTVRLRKWVRPNTRGTIGWMSERRP